MFTVDRKKIGWMPCNPAIGGPAKGQMVSELDALGGQMGLCADETMMQMKVLNRSRGPAVQSLRSQNDKYAYNRAMTAVVLAQERLTVVEGEVAQVIVSEGKIAGIVLQDGTQFFARTVVITTGTFLNGKVHVGLENYAAGRLGEPSAASLSGSLASMGLKMGRLKTGTTPRLDANSLDFSKMVPQPGDPELLKFSFRTPNHKRYQNQVLCYLTETNPDTHRFILSNLDRSPMFQKVIKGTGPRYCPSIEDKVQRFADKSSHQIFIEPESMETREIYTQGMNTSLPRDVQLAMLRSMRGLEACDILEYGYAVEYDFVFPSELLSTLETRRIAGLFLAGQINGTSGYEEAAGQGIIAGINAARKALGLSSFVLTREDSYIGTMIDDLITKDHHEPYRMMTSRSEYRLSLRQDNAIFRLAEKGHGLGLLGSDIFHEVVSLRCAVDNLVEKWRKTSVNNETLARYRLAHKMPIERLVRRPDVSVADLVSLNLLSEEDRPIGRHADIEIKYGGYLEKQKADIEKMGRFEQRPLPEGIFYEEVYGLKAESRLKLSQHRPKSVFEAKRIAGINPADITVLLAHLEKINRRAARV